MGYVHGALYYRPLHRDNWGLILVLIEINRAYIILFSTNCHQFTVKWHRFIIKTCPVYMILYSIFREINIPIEIPVKKSAPSCHDEEACSRVRHGYVCRYSIFWPKKRQKILKIKINQIFWKLKKKVFVSNFFEWLVQYFLEMSALNLLFIILCWMYFLCVTNNFILVDFFVFSTAIFFYTYMQCVFFFALATFALKVNALNLIH